nr:hypothetical protein [Tanacetum cinerariifolium]
HPTTPPPPQSLPPPPPCPPPSPRHPHTTHLPFHTAITSLRAVSSHHSSTIKGASGLLFSSSKGPFVLVSINSRVRLDLSQS